MKKIKQSSTVESSSQEDLLAIETGADDFKNEEEFRRNDSDSEIDQDAVQEGGQKIEEM